mgnify:CR=1 FL=1
MAKPQLLQSAPVRTAIATSGTTGRGIQSILSGDNT